MVTHQAPQMKNWRNIIVDRRARTETVRVCWFIAGRPRELGDAGDEDGDERRERPGPLPPRAQSFVVTPGRGITAESRPAWAQSQ